MSDSLSAAITGALSGSSIGGLNRSFDAISNAFSSLPPEGQVFKSIQENFSLWDFTTSSVKITLSLASIARIPTLLTNLYNNENSERWITAGAIAGQLWIPAGVSLLWGWLPLGGATIGGAITSIVLSILKEDHPTAQRPLIAQEAVDPSIRAKKFFPSRHLHA